MGKTIIIKGADFSANAIETDFRVVKGIIANDNTQRIFSGIPFSDNFKVELKMRYTDFSGSGIIWGSKTASGLALHASPTNANFGLFYIWDNSDGKKVGSNPTSTDSVFKVVIENNQLTVNDSAPVSFIGKPAESTIFGGRNGGTVNVMVGYELYYYKQWNDGILVIDAVPVVTKDGVVCLYNRVDGNYYTASSNPSYEEF